MTYTSRDAFHLNIYFGWSFETEYYNNLNVLTNAYLSPQQIPTSETIKALESVHSNCSKHFNSIRSYIFNLEQDLSRFIEQATGEDDSAPQYFSSFLQEKIPPEHWIKVRNLLVSAFTITMVFSYPTPGEGRRRAREYGFFPMSSGSPYPSSGSVSELYRKNNYEAIPHLRQVGTLKAKIELAEPADNDLAIFAGLVKRYVTMVDHIISYHPDSAEDHNPVNKAEDALCQNVLDKIVNPINDEISRILSVGLRSSPLNGVKCEESVERETIFGYFPVWEFWCEMLLVDLDSQAAIGNAAIGNDAMIKQIQQTGLTVISNLGSNFADSLSGVVGPKPNGKFVISVFGTENVFKGELLNSFSAACKDLPARSDLLRMNITAFPIDVKKQVFSSSKVGYGIQLANEKIEEVTLDVQKGWSIAEILRYPTFLKILQQGVRYLTWSSELLCNHVIYVFPHHGVVYFVHLEIDLDALEFKDHPTDTRVKTVSLQINKREVNRENVEKDKSSNSETAVILEKIVPVKLRAYPLEPVAEKTKVPLLSGMVAMIVLVHKVVQIYKDPKKISEIRIKMVALREALKKDSDRNKLVKVPKRKKRRQMGSDNEDHTESEKTVHSQDKNKKESKKRTKTSSDNQTSEKITLLSPPKQNLIRDYHEEQDVQGKSTQNTTDSPGKAPPNPPITIDHTSVNAESSDNKEENQVTTDTFDELILHLQAEDEGPLDYVTNDIKLYSKPVIHTTMRALTLEKKFGVKLLCRGRNFMKRNQLASVLFMSKDTLHQSVEGLVLDSVNISGSYSWKVLCGGDSKMCKYDRLAFKYYSPEILYETFRLDDEHHPDDKFADFLDHVHRRYYFNEWRILKLIQEHNDTAGQSGDYSKTVAIPKALFRGEQLTLKLGRWGDSDDMGWFMVTEALTPDNGGWKNCLPLPESVVADTCNQIEVMTKKVHISHNDLKISNMIYTKGRVHFIDFGHSKYVGEWGEDELDTMVREDQATIRDLLLSGE